MNIVPRIAASSGIIALIGLTRGASAVTVGNSLVEFSGVQGHLGWNYGFEVNPSVTGYTSNGFLLMTNFDPTNPDTYGAPQVGLWSVSAGVSEFWTAIAPSGGHGNGVITSGNRTPIEQWAVRRWTSDVAASVTITGQYADTYIGGNGTHARLFLNGTQIWDARILDGTPPTAYSVTTTVSIGSILDFAIDPEASDDRSDSSMFTSVINAGLLAGDADCDGSVSFADLLALARNYGAAGTEHTWSEGDFDNSGTIDFADLLSLARNYGSSGGQPAAFIGDAQFQRDWALAQSLVPEPATLTAVAGLSLLHGRRRR